MVSDDLSELVITQGRAYHAGDVVVIRMAYPLTEQEMARITDRFADVSAETGVKFVLLDPALTVVEPEAPRKPYKPGRPIKQAFPTLPHRR